MKFRIEIPSKVNPSKKFVLYIGKGLELVSNEFEAIDCTEEESLQVMERIEIPGTVCYRN